MNDVARALAMLARGAEGDELRQKALPEAVINDLKLLLADYQAGCTRFKVGDIVTAKKGYKYACAGEPHIVVEVRPDASFNFDGPTGIGSPSHGARPDMRIACRDQVGEYGLHWVESFAFDFYTPPEEA